MVDPFETKRRSSDIETEWEMLRALKSQPAALCGIPLSGSRFRCREANLKDLDSQLADSRIGTGAGQPGSRGSLWL